MLKGEPIVVVTARTCRVPRTLYFTVTRRGYKLGRGRLRQTATVWLGRINAQ